MDCLVGTSRQNQKGVINKARIQRSTKERGTQKMLGTRRMETGVGAGRRQTGAGSISFPSQAVQLCEVDPSSVETTGAIHAALCYLSI